MVVNLKRKMVVSLNGIYKQVKNMNLPETNPTPGEWQEIFCGNLLLNYSAVCVLPVFIPTK
jgi:hypothetical protein